MKTLPLEAFRTSGLGFSAGTCSGQFADLGQMRAGEAGGARILSITSRYSC